MKKILIIKHGSLGDIISATAVIKPIRENFINSHITILTSKSYIDFFHKSKLSNLIIEDNRKGLKKIFNIIYKILSMKFDLIIDLQNSNRTFFYCIFLRLFSSAKINGTHLAANYRFEYDKKNPPNVISGLGGQIKLLGIQGLKKPFLLWLDDKNFYSKDLLNKNFFIINPGCSPKNIVKKRWSSKNFSEICKFLIEINILPVVIGAGKDKDIINEIENKESRILNLYNKSPIEVIYNLAKNAHGALSNDTGPAHLIAATNCKLHLVLSSYSNTKTVIPQSNNVTYSQKKYIDKISSSEVINKIKKLLANEN